MKVRNLFFMIASIVFLVSLFLAVVELILLWTTQNIWHGYALCVCGGVAMVAGVMSGIMEPDK